MVRRFYINMTQKGKFLDMYSRSLVNDEIIKFTKTDKKQVEIAEIEWDELIALDRAEFFDEQEKGFFVYPRKRTVENILGIGIKNPYRFINRAREIKDTKYPDYVEISAYAVEKESDKAYLINNVWIAKSLTIKGEEGKLYLKKWVFFKEFC